MVFIKCPKCNGRGRLPDQRFIGSQQRKRREKAGKSVREVARIMGFSGPYISDLELGRKQWTEKLLRAFNAACS